MTTDSPPTISERALQTSSPTVWKRWLATELRRLRDSMGLSQGDAAGALGCQVPKISLLEGGQRNIRDADLKQLLTLYEVPEVEWGYYLTAAKRSRGKGWWETYDGAGTLPAPFLRYLGLEQGAEQIRTYHPAIFHGLLQTADYAAAVLKHSTKGLGPEWIDRAVALRRRRQAAIWRDRAPLHLAAVVDESALHRAVGGPEVMRAQLLHVVGVVEKYGNISIQIMPFKSGVISPEFAIFSFPWPDDPGVVYLEHHGGGTYLESLPEIDILSYSFEQLRSLALSEQESTQRLLQAADDYAGK